jgi:hypothetical protein
LLSDAFVAWIKHVPTVVAVIVLLAVSFARAQVDASPPTTTAYVVDPLPEPPDGVIVNTWLYEGPLRAADVVLIVKLNVAWLALVNSKVAVVLTAL